MNHQMSRLFEETERLQKLSETTFKKLDEIKEALMDAELLSRETLTGKEIYLSIAERLSYLSKDLVQDSRQCDLLHKMALKFKKIFEEDLKEQL